MSWQSGDPEKRLSDHFRNARNALHHCAQRSLNSVLNAERTGTRNRVAEVLLERSQEKQLPLPHMMFMQTAPERTQPIITTEELESLLENYAVRNQTELDADTARYGDPRRADGVNANAVRETRKSKERQLALRAQQDGRLPNLHRKLNSFRAALSDASSRGVLRNRIFASG